MQNWDTAELSLICVIELTPFTTFHGFSLWLSQQTDTWQPATHSKVKLVMLIKPPYHCDHQQACRGAKSNCRNNRLGASCKFTVQFFVRPWVYPLQDFGTNKVNWNYVLIRSAETYHFHKFRTAGGTGNAIINSQGQGDKPVCSTRDEISQPSRPFSPRAATGP